MRSIYEDVTELLAANHRFALATVIQTRGSTPQKPGAKSIFLPDGRVIGTLGGGCLEAEARRRSLEALQDGKSELLELHLDDDFGWDDGLICGGTARIFIDAEPKKRREIFVRVVHTLSENERGVLASIVDASEVEMIGVRCLIRAGGELEGLPPHHPLAEALRAEAENVLQNAEEVTKTLKVPSEGKLDIRLQEYQEYTVYFEPLLPRPTLLIAGAGHIGAALAHLGALLDFEVVVVDDRPSFANKERLPEVDKVIVADIVKTVKEFPITPETFIVIVTRGHRHDASVLRECINSNAGYIGMIGSRRKIKLIYDELLEEGLTTPERLAQVHSPLGLDIGSVSVWEIAVSIAAELIWVRQGKKGNCQPLQNAMRKLVLKGLKSKS